MILINNSSSMTQAPISNLTFITGHLVQAELHTYILNTYNGKFHVVDIG